MMRRWLIKLLRPPGIHRADFYTIGPECFGVGWDDDFPERHGYPTHICFRGETFVPLQPTLRVRLHNWLVAKEKVRV
jgi:hypothetical protein